MASDLEPGIHDLDAATYHALPHLSRSTIHTLLTKSPAHAKMGMSDESNGAMRLGTVWHKLVLGKGDERVPTLLYNGYGEYVAGLYKDIKGEQLFI